MSEHHIEDLLERVWCAREEDRRLTRDDDELTRGSIPDETVEQLLSQGLARSAEGELQLTDAGELRARGVVRRHRLAEELLSLVLQLEGKEMFLTACGFEHVLTPSVTDRICTLLGHPTVCPHGRSIPRGDCCERQDMQVGSMVEPLTQLPVGTEARIVFMSPKQPHKMDRLMALGMLPGTSVRLQQKKPAYVVRVGETTIAVDEDILREVFVRSPDIASGSSR